MSGIDKLSSMHNNILSGLKEKFSFAMLGHKDGYDVAEEHAELGETPVSIDHVVKSVFFRFF